MNPRTRITRALWLPLALGGATLCAILFFQSLTLTHRLPGCGAASSCNQVMATRWSTVLGIPVSLPALGGYLTLIILWRYTAWTGPEKSRQRAWLIATGLAVMILLAAAWFVIVQAVILRQWCVYCTSTHALGAALALLILLGRPRAFLSMSHRLTAAALGVLAVALLIAIQALTPPPGPRVIQFAGLIGTPTHLPTHGDPNAPFVVLVIQDYTCPHCRDLHQHLRAAQESYGPSLVIAVKPVAQDAACNRHYRETAPEHAGACALAKLALAVWRVDPTKFPAFDDWLYATPGSAQAEGFSPGSSRPGPNPWPREPAAAHAKAQSLVDPVALDEALRSSWVSDTLAANIELSEQFGGVLPITLARKIMLLGRPNTPADTRHILEQQFGPPPSPNP
jgi:uncharacterized membrane protein